MSGFHLFRDGGGVRRGHTRNTFYHYTCCPGGSQHANNLLKVAANQLKLVLGRQLCGEALQRVKQRQDEGRPSMLQGDQLAFCKKNDRCGREDDPELAAYITDGEAAADCCETMASSESAR